jgi:hypothetical protein
MARQNKAGFDAGTMGMADIITRIEQRLHVLGISASAASDAAGMSKDAIRNWKRRLARGEINAGMSIRSLERLAIVLKTTVHWLQTGQEPPATGVQRINARVLPMLTWENPRIPEHMSGQRMVMTVGLPETGQVFALRVHDNTMNLVSPVDSIIYVDAADQRPFDQGFYIIETPDGVLYRQFQAPDVWRGLSSYKRDVKPVTGPVSVVGRVLKTELML